LAVNGSNFPLWSALLKDLVLGVTQVADYFKRDLFEDDVPTALGVLAMIKNSIDEALHLLLHGAWVSLYQCFSGPSWSLLLNRWSEIAQPPDALDSISSGYESLKRSLLDLEERLGGWTTDKLLSLTFNSSIYRYRGQVADTMDSCLAIFPGTPISPIDLRNVATRIHQSSSAQSSGTGAHSVMAVSSQRGRGGRSRSSRGGHVAGA
jgi:hypothetical protein